MVFLLQMEFNMILDIYKVMPNKLVLVAGGCISQPMGHIIIILLQILRQILVIFMGRF